MSKDLPRPSTSALHAPPTEGMLLSSGQRTVLFYTLFHYISLLFTSLSLPGDIEFLEDRSYDVFIPS